jgi:two-component system, chemotaxis family, protein-glutamate methylesterase/glutaminase
VTTPIVVIGGSKGGVEALTQAFGAMPKRIRAPIAMVLHRRADSTAALATFLGRRIHREVIEPNDEEPLLPGRIYLAPADYHMMIEPAALRLDVSAPVFFARPSIDVLFETAADSFRERATAVLLSGASEDGAAGLFRIAAYGGVAIVQEPTTAASSVAPRAALAMVRDAEVLTPDAIGRFLAAHCR